MAEEYIKVEKLCKNYGGIEAVKNVSFTATAGEIIALLGPNGAGKSTLMNMISGYLSPTDGEIYICGKNIKTYPLWGREHIGFLPEGSPLYADLTVRDFLFYMADLRGCPHSAAENAIDLSNVRSVARQKLETLSKGYQRRVGFAQSILSNPPVLMLDEPTDGLDPRQKQHIRSLIGDMRKDKTVLISTHLLEEAETICSRILLINCGEVVIDGTLVDILRKSGASTLEKAFFKLTDKDGEKA